MAQPAQNSFEPSDEEIALGAYRIWLQEGFPHGRDKEHWLKAREQLIASKAAERAEGEEEKDRAQSSSAGQVK